MLRLRTVTGFTVVIVVAAASLLAASVLFLGSRPTATPPPPENISPLEALSKVATRLAHATASHEARLRETRDQVGRLRDRVLSLQQQRDCAGAASRSLTPESTDYVPFVFVAGVEGTGHHWYKSLFEVCRVCRPSQVGPLAWQRSAAAFGSKMDAEAPARRAGVEAAARDLVAAAGDRVVFALNTLGGLNDAAMATLRATGTEPPWTQGEGMLSYPNWWSSPNKAVQMPSLLAMSDSLFAARGPATPQLRVVLTTRSATAIVASVCEKRNFGREVGGCATEVSMLVLGAAALTAQISALPPPPAAVCQHFEFEHLQGGDAATLDRLARFLRLDDDNLANLARRVNSKAHSTPSSAGRKLGAAWRAALASDLSRGQETLIRTCVNHGGERRGSTSR